MERVTVVGAGVMGKGIAYAFAISNFQVVLNDIRLEALQKAEADINQLLNDSFQKGFLSEVQYARAKENLQYDMELASAVKDADLVVEAVIERMDIKADVFQKLDKLCKSDAVLATNTSTMSPTEIGAQTSRPDKVVAMHFFNPVHKMKLIEIVRGLETSDETVQFAKEVATKLKKNMLRSMNFPDLSLLE